MAAVDREALLRERTPRLRHLETRWSEGVRVADLAAELGLSTNELTSLVTYGRVHGFDLPRRRGAGIKAPDAKVVKRQFARQSARPRWGRLTEKQSYLCRLLAAAPEPLAICQMVELLCQLPTSPPFYLDHGSLYTSLRRLSDRGVVVAARDDGPERYAARVRWVLREVDDIEILTLADARRERELQDLLAEQARDAARGHFAETDYKSAFSLDRAVTEDGGSFHDLLEDVA